MSWLGPGCLLFTGLFAWILGLTSIGLWVGCYFECPTGRETDFNYYVAVWTGVVAFVTGILHMLFCCAGRKTEVGKPISWSAAICSFILLPCTLLLTTLSGYLAWREWDTEQKYQDALADPDENPEELQGDHVTGVALFACMAVVGLLLLVVTCIFNCYHCCGDSAADEEEVEVPIEPFAHEENPYRRSGQNNEFFYQERGQTNPPQYTREAGYRDPGYNKNSADYQRGPQQGYRPRPAPATYSQPSRDPPRQPTYRDAPRRPYPESSRRDYPSANRPANRDQMRWERTENSSPWDDNFNIGSNRSAPRGGYRQSRPTATNYY